MKTSFLLQIISPLLLFALTTAKAQLLQSNLQITAATETTPAYLELTLIPTEAESHWYYIAPGIGGMAPKIEWNLPQGWSIGTPLYPLPQRFESFGTVNWGYESAATIRFPLYYDENDAEENKEYLTSGTIEVEVQALICTKEACQLGNSATSLQVDQISLTSPTSQPLLSSVPLVVAVTWDFSQEKLLLHLPATTAVSSLIAVLPVEEILDLSSQPEQQATTEDFITWAVDFAPNPGEQRPLEAWLIQDDTETQIPQYVLLNPR